MIAKISDVTPSVIAGAMVHWQGKLGGAQAQMYLDRLALLEGRAQGLAYLRAGAAPPRALAVDGKVGREDFDLRLRAPGVDGNVDIYALSGKRAGEAFRGTWTHAGNSVPVDLAPVADGQDAASPRWTDALPFDGVSCAMHTNLGDIVLDGWSTTPQLVPMGTWRGPLLGGTQDGLVALQHDPFTGVLCFVLTTWNPSVQVARAHVKRDRMGAGGMAPLEDGSQARSAERWVALTGTFSLRGRAG
jgi:hypothetical protein